MFQWLPPNVNERGGHLIHTLTLQIVVHSVSPLPLALYVHFPWCLTKCPYCDFNSHIVPEKLDQNRYIRCLLHDLRADLELYSPRPVSSIFLGGGTPSLFAPESFAQLFDGLADKLDIAADCEVTMECNPETSTKMNFRAYRAVGINRLSIGVQSFDDRSLRAIGRIHDSAKAVYAFECAAAAGFESINIDLMYGLPGQSFASAMADVRMATALQPEHISYYQLTIEPATAFYRQRPRLPTEDNIFKVFQEARQYLEKCGYPQYEVSAYGKVPCRHNLNYWEFGDYIAIGAGAHGKYTHCAYPSQNTVSHQVLRYEKLKHPRSYMQSCAAGREVSKRHRLSTEDIKFDFFLNALRLRHGFSETLFVERTGVAISELRKKLSTAVELGLVQMANGRVCPSNFGFLFLDEILQTCLPSLPN